MTNKKDAVIAVLFIFCLATSLFMMIKTSNTQVSREYDPWLDVNDDGKIDMKDIGYVIQLFGTSGTAINKTELLLEIQSRLNALETRLPKKGFLSISPMAFLPIGSSSPWWYQKTTTYIEIVSHTYYAPLQLPNGINVTKMTAYLHDENVNRRLNVTLYRRDQVMAQVTSGSYNGGDLVTYDETIDFGLIDCQNYTYSLEMTADQIDQTGIGLYWVVLEYEYPL